MGCLRLVYEPYAFYCLFIPTGKTNNIVPYLDALQFRNGPSFVNANQSFGWNQFCSLYSEPENVSTIRFGWDSLGQRSYLFQNPSNFDKQQSPPSGMRSAVPLGGLGKPSDFSLRLFSRNNARKVNCI